MQIDLLYHCLYRFANPLTRENLANFAFISLLYAFFSVSILSIFQHSQFSSFLPAYFRRPDDLRAYPALARKRST